MHLHMAMAAAVCMCKTSDIDGHAVIASRNALPLSFRIYYIHTYIIKLLQARRDLHSCRSPQMKTSIGMH